MKEYLVIFEWAGSNYSAYVPDLPGCISTGKTLAEIELNIKEAILLRNAKAILLRNAKAIELYLDTLKEDGQLVPEPTVLGKAISVAA